MHGVIYFILYCILRYLTQNMKNKLFLKYYENNPIKIYDIGFEYIPIINWHFLDDIMVVLPIILCFYYKINFSNFLFLLTCIYLLRELTTAVTLLPPPPFCVEINSDKMSKSKVLTKIAGSCNETIFSGHTTFMLLCLLFVLPKINDNYIKIAIYTYALLTSFIIVAMRSHYTIDVVIAWVICVLVYISFFGNKIVKKLILN